VITSAHAKAGVINGKNYLQIYGTWDCAKAGVNCTSTTPLAYDNGGQYDSVSFRQCGKEVKFY
jgi:hypothetical protein